MNVNWRGALIYLLILVAAGALILGIFPMSSELDEIPISELVQDINDGRVRSIAVEENNLEVTYRDGRTIASLKEDGVDLPETLLGFGVTPETMEMVDIQVEPPSPWGEWLAILGSFLPFIFLAVLFIFLMRQAQGTNNQALSFGKSRARMFTGEKPTVTFDDVAGVDEAKQELAEVVEFLREPQKFISLGARIPKGVVLMGPPGTGKTLLAKAVSGEAGVPFFSISGSEFVEMFVGVGASRVRDLFDQAKRHTPCIIFVDEIDAVGRQRGAGLGGSHDEREQTLNQILTEMDGFDTNTSVIVLAATNRPDILDPALLRPGRFDRRVVLNLPDITGREAILRVHSKEKPLDKSVSLELLAKQTAGFSGADLENLINEAAILAARSDNKYITMEELEESIDKVQFGPERKSRRISPKEKEITAYHEAGHALVAHILENIEPVRKITIIPRGIAGGYTKVLEEDRTIHTRSLLKDTLAFMLAGHGAEDLIFNERTSGPHADIKQATKLARQMVIDLGMSDVLGPRTFGDKQELVFLGREISEQRDYSERFALEIDREVNKLIDEAYNTAKKILRENKDKLTKIAETLMEKETLEGDELDELFERLDGKKPKKKEAKTAATTAEKTAESPKQKRKTKKTPIIPEPLPGQSPVMPDP